MQSPKTPPPSSKQQQQSPVLPSSPFLPIQPPAKGSAYLASPLSSAGSEKFGVRGLAPPAAAPAGRGSSPLLPFPPGAEPRLAASLQGEPPRSPRAAEERKWLEARVWERPRRPPGFRWAGASGAVPPSVSPACNGAGAAGSPGLLQPEREARERDTKGHVETERGGESLLAYWLPSFWGQNKWQRFLACSALATCPQCDPKRPASFSCPLRLTTTLRGGIS